MEEPVICPWCHTEIVWDEELGPEEHCPHCENELNAYRTISLELDGEDEDDASGKSQLKERQSRYGREEEQEEMDEFPYGGYREISPAQMMLQGKVEAILDGQDEVPECPSCREYMLEAGVQAIGPEGFTAKVDKQSGAALLEAPFEVIWYVCPSCFQTSSRLAGADREKLLKRIAASETTE
ncbi:hypothetical protein DNH61_14440 [Paenibacillus sambharensis]|uniref:Uncharacterized protein n=1 Tax=Paenibacillus sambharensis TaxID=1803190 RepID=A0A2W1L8D6_9BACL|nr:hypothetical protein [Paenibacillus sambharensis]PZD95089.1 hypothetical protein DNH61_14440 [Paenibacillus sambharensis]